MNKKQLILIIILGLVLILGAIVVSILASGSLFGFILFPTETHIFGGQL